MCIQVNKNVTFAALCESVSICREIARLHPERRWEALLPLGALRPTVEAFLALHPERRIVLLGRVVELAQSTRADAVKGRAA